MDWHVEKTNKYQQKTWRFIVILKNLDGGGVLGYVILELSRYLMIGYPVSSSKQFQTGDLLVYIYVYTQVVTDNSVWYLVAIFITAHFPK